MADRDLIRFYFDTLSLHEHLMQWYRAVFVAFNAGVIIAALFLIVEKGVTEFAKFVSPIVICGLMLNFLWVLVTSQRARIVERQKNKIKSLLEKGDKRLKDCFKIYESKWAKYLPEITFNILLPLFIGWGLIYMLWEFALPYLPESSLLNRFLLIWPLEFECTCSIFCALLAVVFLTFLIVALTKWSWLGVPDRPKKGGQQEEA